MNVLFICSRNKWRSPTAERIFKDYPGIRTQSAGTSGSSAAKVSSKSISWADLIFVMEKKHQVILLEKFPVEIHGKKVAVLDIEDEYQYMDEDLIDELKAKVDPYLRS